MVHAKLLMSEKQITLGSANINKKAFCQLDELNLLVPRDGGAFSQAVSRSVEESFGEARRCAGAGEIAYHRLFAAMEGLLM